MTKLDMRLVLCSLTLAAAPPALGATIKTVALQFGNSPITGIIYKKFENPVVSDAASERVGVFTQLGFARRCIFTLDPDTMSGSTIVCRRDPTPDGHVFAQIGAKVGGISINASSAVGWAARETSGRSGAFRNGPAFVAATGDSVPAPGTGLLKSITFGRIDDTSDVIFIATISGGAVVSGVEVNQGIFRCSGGDGNCSTGGTGTLTTIALVNDGVADRAGRKFCKFLDLDGSTFGAVFRASTQLDCADNSETPAVGVFRQPVAGSATTVALEGEACTPSPGAGGTTYFRISGAASIANSGMVAFGALTTGLVSNNILYLCDPGTCPASPATDAVTQGQLDGNNNVFRSFSAPAVDDIGEIAFSAKSATISSGTKDALYLRHTNGTIDTIALADVTAVPGASPPATFDQLFPPSMSPAGKVAFGARIERGVAPKKQLGIFVFE